MSLFALFALLFATCNSGNTPAPNGTTPTTRPTSVVNNGGGSATPPSSVTPSASVTPAVLLGPQPCPASVKDPAHWDAIIPTQPNTSKVEGVTCGNLTGNATLQALVTVRYSGTGAMLDVYVFDNITSPTPSQLFKLQGLYDGDARISNYNTILTAEVDLNSSVNLGQPNASLTQDLFREFNTGTFAPVSFPGIFPDMTRFQAERDQAQVNQGQNAWTLNAQQVATNFASDPQLLNWTNSTEALVSGGGPSDAEAVVNVKNNNPGGAGVTLTLQRLEGNTNGGIWEITSVTSNGMSITSPKSRDVLSSPVTVTGTGNAFEGTIGTVMMLDHTYTDIGHATALGASGNGATTFSVSVTYHSTFKTGMEDGIVVLYEANNAGASYAAAVMVKELV